MLLYLLNGKWFVDELVMAAFCVAAYLDRLRKQNAQKKRKTAMTMMTGTIAAATGMEWPLSVSSEVDWREYIVFDRGVSIGAILWIFRECVAAKSYRSL